MALCSAPLNSEAPYGRCGKVSTHHFLLPFSCEEEHTQAPCVGGASCIIPWASPLLYIGEFVLIRCLVQHDFGPSSRPVEQRLPQGFERPIPIHIAI